MDEQRVARVGRNEALFRIANEERERLASEADLPELVIVCECGHSWCREGIVVSPEEYRRARAEPDRFFVVPGHQIEDVEDVAAVIREPQGHYYVVAKREGLPSAIAEATDPNV